MSTKNLSRIALLGAGLSLLAIPQAAAASGTLALGHSVLAAEFVGACNRAASRPVVSAVAAPAPRQTKAAAILDQPMSALERIRQQQAAAETVITPGAVVPAAGAADVASLEGNADGAACPVAALADAGVVASLRRYATAGRSHSAPMRDIVAMPTEVALPATALPAPTGAEPLLLASRRIRIGQTPFDAKWAAATRRGIAGSTVRGLVETTGDEEETLGRVNAWVNANIRYVEDVDGFGKADYWADAPLTMALRQGDCEDFAILKMQMLQGLGFAREDMVLTIARDRIRGRDHAVLMVRIGDGYRMLDNATDAVLDGSQDWDYRPIVSLSAAGSWLHGY